MKLLRLLPLVLALLLPALPARADVVLPILVPEWPPITCSDQQHPGFVTEVVTSAFALSGIGVRYFYDPWPRNFRELSNGHVFAATPYTKTESRLEEFSFSRPFIKANTCVFFNRKTLPNYDYHGPQDLAPHRLGGLTGWFYMEDWDRRGFDYTAIRDPGQAFKMLARDRLDLFVFDEYAGKNFMRRAGVSESEVGRAASPYNTVFVYLMASRTFPDSNHYLAIFNENVVKLFFNGEFERIAAKYDIPLSSFLPAE